MTEKLFHVRHRDQFGRMVPILDETGQPALMTKTVTVAKPVSEIDRAKKAMATMNKLYGGPIK